MCLTINGVELSRFHESLVADALRREKKRHDRESGEAINGTYGALSKANAERCQEMLDAIERKPTECTTAR